MNSSVVVNIAYRIAGVLFRLFVVSLSDALDVFRDLLPRQFMLRRADALGFSAALLAAVGGAVSIAAKAFRAVYVSVAVVAFAGCW